MALFALFPGVENAKPQAEAIPGTPATAPRRFNSVWGRWDSGTEFHNGLPKIEIPSHRHNLPAASFADSGPARHKDTDCFYGAERVTWGDWRSI
jgi:hypothetical protein